MNKKLNSATIAVVYDRKKGHHTVEIRLYFKNDGKQTYVSTGVTVSPEEWNKEMRVINPSPDFVLKQTKIDKVKYGIAFTIQKMEYDGITVDKDSFVDAYKGQGDKKKKSSPLLYLFCAKAVDEASISKSSKKTQQRTLSLIRELSATLTLNDINITLATKWDKFLHSKYDNLNTIAGHHKNLKRYLIIANEEGLLSDDNLRSYKKFKAPRIQGSREALTFKQLAAIENLEYKEFTLLDNVKNMFLFACYTGLRISDVTGLEPSHIIAGDARGMLIKKPVYKLRHLNREIILPIEKLFDGKPYDLIKKYMKEYTENKTVFPSYAHQVLNRYLKVVAHDAGIDTPITFHYARHTFLTIIALKTGNIFMVMDYGGITSVGTAQGYIHTASKWLDKGLQSIDWSMAG